MSISRRILLRRLAALPLVTAAVGAGCSQDIGSKAKSDKDSADGQLDTAETGPGDATAKDSLLADGSKSEDSAVQVPGDATATGDGAGPLTDASTGDDTVDLTGDASATADSTDTDAADSAGSCPKDMVKPKECNLTGADLEGPYYEAGAPYSAILVDAKEAGAPLLIEGRVLNSTCSPIPGEVELDIWHANAKGEYYNQPGLYRLRRRLKTTCGGHFSFRTIQPGAYLDGGGYRPKHIHIKILSGGKDILTTQLYFAGDPYLGANDSCGVCNSEDGTHIIALKPWQHGGKKGWRGVFPIVLGTS